MILLFCVICTGFVFLQCYIGSCGWLACLLCSRSETDLFILCIVVVVWWFPRLRILAYMAWIKDAIQSSVLAVRSLAAVRGMGSKLVMDMDNKLYRLLLGMLCSLF